MNKLMQALYSYTLDATYEKYCTETDFSALCAARDDIGRSYGSNCRRTNATCWKTSSAPTTAHKCGNWKSCF